MKPDDPSRRKGCTFTGTHGLHGLGIAHAGRMGRGPEQAGLACCCTQAEPGPRRGSGARQTSAVHSTPPPQVTGGLRSHGTAPTCSWRPLPAPALGLSPATRWEQAPGRGVKETSLTPALALDSLEAPDVAVFPQCVPAPRLPCETFSATEGPTQCQPWARSVGALPAVSCNCALPPGSERRAQPGASHRPQQPSSMGHQLGCMASEDTHLGQGPGVWRPPRPRGGATVGDG